MGHFTERCYDRSPIRMQQAMVAVYGWWWFRRRFGRRFRGLVASLRDREHWTAAQFDAFQQQQLGRILTAAWRSPYYREVFTAAGVSPELEPFAALRRLPILSKEMLRAHGRDLLTEKRLPRGTIAFRSSGTTGTPTEIFYPRDFHALEMAVPEARNLRCAGVTSGERRVMFGVRKVCAFDQSAPPFWRFSPAENLAYASIYHLAPRFLPHYVEFLRSYRPAIVMGYPSALNTIASYALEANDLPFPAKAVLTTSETVTADAREKIEAAFGCRIFDRYCAVEMCLFASQCEYGRYHVSPDVGIVEIIDADGRPAPRGTVGQVICTGLHNTLQPLIRYQIGDVARWAVEQDCACKRAMPILEAIEGRYEDICYLPDGREMLRFDTVFKGVRNIREAQVVQDAFDSFVIHVVPAQGFGGAEVELIKHNMQCHAGAVRVEVRQVDAIERTAAGKFRAVVSNLSRADKEGRLPPPSRVAAGR